MAKDSKTPKVKTPTPHAPKRIGGGSGNRSGQGQGGSNRGKGRPVKRGNR